MNFNLIPIMPEIFLTSMILVILMVDAFITNTKSLIIKVLTVSTIVIAFILQIVAYKISPNVAIFNNMFILDNLAQGTKIIVYLISFVILFYVECYIQDKKINLAEYFIIFLFAILGIEIMVSANNMLVLYVGLELMSLALYSLVAINRDDANSTEAAMKFFILGSLASGVLLFGISFVYGATGGNLELQTILKSIYLNHVLSPSLLIFGLVFIVAGLSFKLGLVPFHMWVPDVYEGSPLPSTLIIASITKVASVVFILRILIASFVILNNYWIAMLEVLAILSLFIGNVVAILQTNIKRMLGYSAISNMGFIALGIITSSSIGISATIFYVIVYTITTLLAFAVLIFLSHSNYECQNIEDLRGLSKSHPIYAGIILIAMFSLACIPPFAGFYAKLSIIQTLIQNQHIILSIYTVIMSLIGAFYYLRVVKVVYFDDVAIELQSANIGVVAKILLGLNTVSIIFIGLFPNSLFSFSNGLIS
jgi:NADH-quinone oxidoreductase subunit N